MEVLSGTDISGEVLKLIDGAKERLLLVTPYFDPWDRLKMEIRRACGRPGLRVGLLLRGGEDKEKQEAKAAEIRSFGAAVEYLSRLHAKIYLSESTAIVSSMNLLKSSAIDSWEVAIRLDRTADAAGYADVQRAAGELVQRAVEERKMNTPTGFAAVTRVFEAALQELTKSAAPAAPARQASQKAAPRPARGRAPAGACIRCAASIALNAERPYCATCYASWVRYQNPEYGENHCHSCGAVTPTSMVKPLCRTCWSASR
jgi:phosphatidylserine/phosphatidylglycerophosphate/cardiolipin synthase-like enzyme